MTVGTAQEYRCPRCGRELIYWFEWGWFGDTYAFCPYCGFTWVYMVGKAIYDRSFGS
jgi:DNA-directed RNA polymerase subunit RPC12/RpoP